MSREQIQTLKEELVNQIVELGLIDGKKYKKEKSHADNTGSSSYDLLIKDGDITVEAMLKGLSKKYSIPFELKPQPILPKISKFPVAFCIKNGVIPITEESDKIVFGLCHPGSLNALKNLSLMIGKKTSATFIPPEFIFQSILQKHIHTISNLEQLDENKSQKKNLAPSRPPIKNSKNIIKLDLDTIKSEKKVEPILDLAALGQKKTKIPSQNGLLKPKETELDKLEVNLENLDLAPKALAEKTHSVLDKKNLKYEDIEEKVIAEVTGDVVKVVDEILSEAVTTGVSDVHIEIFKETAQIRFRGNGSLITQGQYKKFITDNYNAVIARIKILANLDIAERRLPQDGKISYRAKNGTEVDFRISLLPTSLGERVVIRILNSSSLAVTISAIGFTKQQQLDFVKSIEAPQGMVLVTGPTGSGKSTTLYGAMNYLNKPDVNILTAEDPVEYTMSGISQVQVREDIGLTFANALRSFLRQDPEIILVGEIRDAETADIASKAALTGHLVLSTLHTNSAIGAISRLVNMGLPAYLVSSALSLIVAQRLIRTICTNCTEKVDKNSVEIKTFIKEYNISDKAKLSKGSGCKNCKGTGYFGRKGVHEVLVVNEQIAEAISAGKTELDILQIAETAGFIPISESGKRFLEDGSLSIEEYLRAIPQDE